jgi:hypothetical protein
MVLGMKLPRVILSIIRRCMGVFRGFLASERGGKLEPPLMQPQRSRVEASQGRGVGTTPGQALGAGELQTEKQRRTPKARETERKLVLARREPF